MATNKNQHFVPRCYLRPFTWKAEGIAINVFNLERQRLILGAPVKHQSSKDYFYGTDAQLENAIQLIESGYSRSQRELEHRCVSLSDANKVVLQTFWLFQHLRTEAAAIRAAEMSESMRRFTKLPAEEWSLGIKEAVQIACRAFADLIDEINDLKFCLFKNRTSLPFISSDNPAVLTNKWRLEKDRSPGLSFGFGSAGALAILPISPKLLLLGYDGDVYNVANSGGIVELNNNRDVLSLNRHQFLQCNANVYACELNSRENLLEQYSKVSSARPSERHVVHYAQIEEEFVGGKRYVVVPPAEREDAKEAIMHSQVIHPNPAVWPSQIRLRKTGSIYTNGTGRGYVRAAKAFSYAGPPFWRERP